MRLITAAIVWHALLQYEFLLQASDLKQFSKFVQHIFSMSYQLSQHAVEQLSTDRKQP